MKKAESLTTTVNPVIKIDDDFIDVNTGECINEKFK